MSNEVKTAEDWARACSKASDEGCHYFDLNELATFLREQGKVIADLREQRAAAEVLHCRKRDLIEEHRRIARNALNLGMAISWKQLRDALRKIAVERKSK